MGLFGKSSQKEENQSSEKLADQAIKDLNCEQYMIKYRQCMFENVNSTKRAQCIKLLDEFRYCLVYKEQKDEKAEKKVITNELLQKPK